MIYLAFARQLFLAYISAVSQLPLRIMFVLSVRWMASAYLVLGAWPTTSTIQHLHRLSSSLLKADDLCLTIYESTHKIEYLTAVYFVLSNLHTLYMHICMHIYTCFEFPYQDIVISLQMSFYFEYQSDLK